MTECDRLKLMFTNLKYPENLNSIISHFVTSMMTKGFLVPRGEVLWEFLGGDVPLGPWNPQPIPELVQLNFATLY